MKLVKQAPGTRKEIEITKRLRALVPKTSVCSKITIENPVEYPLLGKRDRRIFTTPIWAGVRSWRTIRGKFLGWGSELSKLLVPCNQTLALTCSFQFDENENEGEEEESPEPRTPNRESSR